MAIIKKIMGFITIHRSPKDGDKGEPGRDGTNYLVMGWWDAAIRYQLSDAGIPIVKVEDESDDGFSVYKLTATASTIGAKPPNNEWEKVQSADFIYMQQAYIERLQAQLISAVTVELKEDSSSYFTAGLSGIQGAAKDKPAFWAGGTYDEATSGIAKAIIRHDGTVKFTEGEFTGTVSSNASGSKITIDADSRSLVMSDTNNSEVVKLAFASTGNYSHANFKLSAFTGTTEYSRMFMDAFGMDYRQMSPGASFNTYATIGNGIVEVGSTTSSSSNYLSIQVDSAGIPYIAMAGGVIRGLGVFVRTVSSGTTLFNEDCAIISTATSSITINLPLNPSVGRLCIIAKRGSSASNITVNGNGRQIYSTSSGPVSSILIGSGIFIYTGSYWQYI